jgi:hypothetical protein
MHSRTGGVDANLGPLAADFAGRYDDAAANDGGGALPAIQLF